MDYSILKSHSAEELETRVNEYLLAGYELAGGVAVVSESTDCRYQNYFCQAVLKKNPKVDVGTDPIEPDPDKPDPDEPDPDNPDPGPDTPDVPDPDNPDDGKVDVGTGTDTVGTLSYM